MWFTAQAWQDRARKPALWLTIISIQDALRPRPNVYWAYNTGGQILTSPVISLDGTQVAFVETNGGFGILVLLKWAPGGSVTSPGTLKVVANSLYRTCTAPCATQVLLKNGSGSQTNDTTSSVYYDYASDTGWVGGALSWLHKINGMFKGTPGEVSTSALAGSSVPGQRNVSIQPCV